jgi:hypothetical protein
VIYIAGVFLWQHGKLKEQKAELSLGITC